MDVRDRLQEIDDFTRTAAGLPSVYGEEALGHIDWLLQEVGRLREGIVVIRDDVTKRGGLAVETLAFVDDGLTRLLDGESSSAIIAVVDGYEASSD